LFIPSVSRIKIRDFASLSLSRLVPLPMVIDFPVEVFPSNIPSSKSMSQVKQPEFLFVCYI